MAALAEIPASEVINLAAEDGIFYCRHWFPKAFRQESPEFHRLMWQLLDSPEFRQVAFKIFRGGAKTTVTRAYLSKRIAYGLSRTIMVVGDSMAAACRTTRWLRNQIKLNTRWASFYGLRPGEKFTDEWLEIYHDKIFETDLDGNIIPDEQGRPQPLKISVIAVGMEGTIRGINLDDWRPDFILADDPCDEENTGSETQRKKTRDLFYGSLLKTLARRADAPLAKIALLQTPLVLGDLIDEASKDASWAVFEMGCFDEYGNSRWEALFPTWELKQEKQEHINRNMLHLWLREMEVRVTSELTSSFRSEWLQECLPEDIPGHNEMATYMWIDPVPPPSEAQLEKGLDGKDFECLAVVGYHFSSGNFFLCEYAFNKGHEPDWTIAQFWRLADRWRIRKCRVESVGYQRTLKWLIEQSMKKRKRYLQVEAAPNDQRKKMYRIVDSLNGIASNKRLHVCPTIHAEFIEQFGTYPDVKNDDIIESVAGAAQTAQDEAEILEGEYEVLDDESGGNDGYAGNWAP